mmetsp:Transcript_50492/g.146524  ORF Transcript_50492/g.146524 Transcript_50492/m.146524 type:complete len:362 (+) Transcript_50492:140-1225(+)
MEAPAPATSPFGSRVCRHWLQGYCNWGSTCRFAHDGAHSSSYGGPHDGRMWRASPTEGSPDVADDRPELHADGLGTSPAKQPSSSSKSVKQRRRGRREREREARGEAFQLDASSGTPDPRSRLPHERTAARYWCHIFLYKGHPDFDLVPMLIGKGGCNMRDIYLATKAKIRVRGRGSGHLEVDGKREAPVPLMVAVTANKTDADGFKLAIQMTLVRLKAVDEQFHMFCKTRGFQAPASQLFSIGELSWGAELLLADALRDSGLLEPVDASDRKGAYADLIASLDRPERTFSRYRVRSAVLAAAVRAAEAPEAAAVPHEGEEEESSPGSSATDEDEERLPELISSQVSAFLGQAACYDDPYC